MRLLVTTIVRNALPTAPSGYIYLLDTDKGKVLMRCPVPESLHRAKDPNPRGGLRGAKGISSYGGKVVVANTDSLWIFDKSWNISNRITHPLMSGVHDILAEEDGIWITCTHVDLLIKVAPKFVTSLT